MFFLHVLFCLGGGCGWVRAKTSQALSALSYHKDSIPSIYTLSSRAFAIPFRLAASLDLIDIECNDKFRVNMSCYKICLATNYDHQQIILGPTVGLLSYSHKINLLPRSDILKTNTAITCKANTSQLYKN